MTPCSLVDGFVDLSTVQHFGLDRWFEFNIKKYGKCGDSYISTKKQRTG
jgi:hypothetical protein